MTCSIAQIAKGAVGRFEISDKHNVLDANAAISSFSPYSVPFDNYTRALT
jgi:hypothetical protein